jgi:murein DD-endopeptidase MepM/ murein hydrolase activator NlpD
MPVSKAKRKKIAQILKSKFRFVVMNDQTLEEKFSLRLTPMNIIVVGGSFALILITLTMYLIAFTPIREYIPGYADVNMRRNLIKMTLKTDSLMHKVNADEKYLSNLLDVINGKVDTTLPVKKSGTGQLYDSIQRLNKSDADSQLRWQIENQEQFTLVNNGDKAFSSGIGSYSFFTPLKGNITSKFSTTQKHFGIDVVAGPNEGIKSALDGTVVMANFTSETGYVIGVQHSNNLFTFYKHNSALLKAVGDYVKAGEVIAIIGNSGEFSSGPHLHFELWYNGNPVNPTDYINF